MQDYHQLEIWRRGMDYAVKIYEFSAQLPPDERFNLDEGNQIARMTYTLMQRLEASGE